MMEIYFWILNGSTKSGFSNFETNLFYHFWGGADTICNFFPLSHPHLRPPEVCKARQKKEKKKFIIEFFTFEKKNIRFSLYCVRRTETFFFFFCERRAFTYFFFFFLNSVSVLISWLSNFCPRTSSWQFVARALNPTFFFYLEIKF